MQKNSIGKETTELYVICVSVVQWMQKSSRSIGKETTELYVICVSVVLCLDRKSEIQTDIEKEREREENTCKRRDERHVGLCIGACTKMGKKLRFIYLPHNAETGFSKNSFNFKRNNTDKWLFVAIR